MNLEGSLSVTCPPRRALDPQSAARKRNGPLEPWGRFSRLGDNRRRAQDMVPIQPREAAARLLQASRRRARAGEGCVGVLPRRGAGRLCQGSEVQARRRQILERWRDEGLSV
jgi:hypothetical protein